MTPTASVLSAGLGELCVAQHGDEVLTAQGLGSCIGIAVYEPRRKIAMIAHVMLPGPALQGINPEQPARYAAHAVDAIVKEVERRNGTPRTLVVKLAGGAQVITIPGLQDCLKIGLRNIEAVHEALTRVGLTAVAEEVGGRVGRTLSLHAASGATTVRTVGGVEKPL